jgi:hypothetical protein
MPYATVRPYTDLVFRRSCQPGVVALRDRITLAGCSLRTGAVENAHAAFFVLQALRVPSALAPTRPE